MTVKRSTSQGKTGEKAARKPKCNPAKTLYTSDERFKNIFDESPIGIELYDADGLLIDANPACLRMFGVSNIAQVKGFKLFEDPNLPDEAKAKLRRGKMVRYEAPFDFEKVKELRLYETTKSGIVHLDVLSTPVGVKRKAAPQGYLVQVQDITERKQTEEALRHYAEELAALQATVLDLAAKQDLLSLLNTIVERAIALLNAPCGFIYLHDNKANELELVVEHGLYATPGLRLRMGEGMASQVARTLQPLIVDDYSTWEGRSPHYANVPYHAVVEVPMLFGGQLIGVLGVNETAAARKYNEADVRLLSLFAGQAASAVHNLQLFQGLQAELAERKRAEEELRHYTQQIESLRQVELELAAQLDLNVLLKSIVLRAIELMRGNMGGLYLYRPEQDIIEWAVSLGTQSAPIGSVLHRGEGLSGKVWETGELLFVDDYRCWEGRAKIYKNTDFVSVVGVPVYWGEEFLGVLNVGSDQPGAFSQANTQLLSLFASQAAIAMHNAQLYEAQQKEINERKQAELALREAETKFRTLVEQITAVTYTDAVDEASTTLFISPQIEAISGYSPGEWIADPELWIRLIHPEDRANVLAEHRRTNETGDPFKAEYRVIARDNRIAWVHDEAVLLRDEASQPKCWQGIMLDITASKQAEKAREITHQISQATVSTESLEELYHSIHKLLGELTPVENFYIAMYDPGNDLLSFPYFVDQYDQSPQSVKPGHGLTEYVLRTGKPLLAPPDVFDQLLQQGEVELVGTNSVDWLGVPLKVKEQVIGVMVTQSYTKGIRFSKEDADLLTFVSTQVAMAIERKRAEEEIKQHNQELASLNRASQAITSFLDIQKVLDQIVDLTGSLVNAAYTSIVLIEEDGSLGISAENFQEGLPLGSRARPQGITRQIIASQQPLVFDDVSNDGTHNPAVVAAGIRSYAGLPVSVKGKVLGVLFVHSHTPGAFHDRLPLLTTFVNQVAVAIENAHLYTSLGNEKQRLELLYSLSHHLAESLDSYQVATTALDHICAALGTFKGVIYVPRPETDRWELLAASGMKPDELEAFNQYAGLALPSGLTGWAASHKKITIVPDVARDKHWETIPGLDEWVRSAMSAPLLAGSTIVGVLNLMSDQIAAFREEDVEIVQAAAAPLAVALQNARLYATEKRRAKRLAAISKLSIEIAALHEASPMLNILVTRAAAIMESITCTVMLIDTTTNEACLVAQTGLPPSIPPEFRVPLELPILRHFVETGEPIILPDINHDAPAMRAVLVRPDVQAFFAYPMIRDGRAIGLITFSKLTPYTPSVEEMAACQLLAERAAVALENARLFEETSRSLRQIQALHTIDMTIASSFDLRLTLNIFLEQTRTQLGADAVDVLVYNPYAQTLDYAAGIGFRTTALQGTHLRLGQSYAGIAGLERKTIHVSNLRGHKTDFLRSPNFNAEEFDTYYGVPLIAKGKVKGVLEVFFRSSYHPNQSWMDFLETLGKQAAIAIDNATLFSELQSSNAELTLAYDSTLAGWSKALDLRDKETEGHTQRVLEMTIKLARTLGMPEADLPNIRRGALLHDIGKMAIPDSILHKPGPLTVEDRAIMRQHPVYAQEMLSPISYLRPAMDIPYYHHEKWDGSGYPTGLKGEQIPLAARVFAVVDVFDALTSDRPYRSAWPREKALDYIREQAGKYFDPKVAEVFLKMQ